MQLYSLGSCQGQPRSCWRSQRQRLCTMLEQHSGQNSRRDLIHENPVLGAHKVDVASRRLSSGIRKTQERMPSDGQDGLTQTPNRSRRPTPLCGRYRPRPGKGPSLEGRARGRPACLVAYLNGRGLTTAPNGELDITPSGGMGTWVAGSLLRIMIAAGVVCPMKPPRKLVSLLISHGAVSTGHHCIMGLAHLHICARGREVEAAGGRLLSAPAREWLPAPLTAMLCTTVAGMTRMSYRELRAVFIGRDFVVETRQWMAV